VFKTYRWSRTSELIGFLDTFFCSFYALTYITDQVSEREKEKEREREKEKERERERERDREREPRQLIGLLDAVTCYRQVLSHTQTHTHR
jgi:hypothetical protein